MYSIMSSTIFSLFLAFYTRHQLSKGIDTYRHPAVLALSKALYEPDQALPSPISTDHRVTLTRGSEVPLIKDLGLLISFDVLAQGVNVLIFFARGFFLFTILLLLKVSFAAIPLSDGMRRVLLTQRCLR